MSRWTGISIQEEVKPEPKRNAAGLPVAPVLALPRRGSEAEREMRERNAAQALAKMVGVNAESLKARPPLDWRKTQVALQDLCELPSLTSQTRRFAQTLENENCLLEDVVVEVARDPALAVNVLRMANSVAVGSWIRVTDLTMALQLLGLTRVRMMAQLLLTMGDARGVVPGFDWGQLWLHSAACAELTTKLDQWSGCRQGAAAHLAGLLHDVGKIALSAVVPDAYREVLIAAWGQRKELPPLELAHLGVDHREAGWIFGQEADLPPVVLSAVAHHDAPEHAPPEHQAVVAMVAVANRLAKEYGLGFSGEGWVDETDLKESRVWKVWEQAVGRTLDAEDLLFHLREEWLPSINAELAVLKKVSE